jgi:formylglycine-generating enzyme required for sulfatase activity
LSLELFIRDVEGERKVDRERLPLRVGTGSDCGLRLPGPGGGPVILLDLLDDAPFVQPVGRDDASMAINGEPLAASRRLSHGDELQFFGSRVVVNLDDERLTLDVRLEDSAYVTRPPELGDGGEQPAEETIAPTAFRRATETGEVKTETDRHDTLRIVIGVLLVVLLTSSFLLFTSKSVKFEVSPGEPDDLSVRGGWFRMPLGDRVLMRKGSYTVKVSQEGYYDVTQNFDVGDEQNIIIDINMRKLPGHVTVVTNPPTDATISIDESRTGPAPLGPVELQPGEHSVSVRTERFLPFDGVVTVPGLGRHEQVSVQLVPRWSNVEVTSEPAGAKIFNGEQMLGETPATIELLEGTHQVSIVADGFSAWDGTVVAEPNVDQALPLIRLQPADARLLVNTIPRGANVTVNGRYRGQSPITLDLAPDINYEIGLSRAGYGVTSRKVRLGAAASESITVDLTARTGTVTVNVQPADATVLVDGRARGNGNTTVRLSSAPHRIEVRKDGYESWSRTVTPRPGYPQTLSVRLRSNESIAREAIQTERTNAVGQVLRRVEPGTFTMGSSRSEQGRRANEVIVPVTLSQPFLIGVKEVTNREFAEFRANHDSGSDIHPSMAGDNNPVANVTWADAVQYCNWLSAKEGLTPVYKEEFGKWVAIRPLPDGYRLPTEAEWAWAMRHQGGNGALKFSWGKDWPPVRDAGNYADRSAADLVPTIIPSYDDGFASTAEGGKFPPNAIGIFDGAGNVAEWVNDFYTVPTPGLTTPVKDPIGPDNGNSYVIRGSSWRHAGPTEIRLSYRDYGNSARPDVGFRVARFAE